MSPRSVTDPLVRESPVLNVADTIAHAVTVLRATDLPALPVVDDHDRLKGVFGEREFFGALFPGYLSQMSSAGFVPRSLESVLEKRATCRNEPVGKYMNTEHVDLGPDASDTAVAETFLHHRVLIVPIADHGQVIGVITRADFFRATAERFLAAPS
jgi:CBS-domain-containing membrane protein